MMSKMLELYLHIPFCVRKCAYCDFLSFSASEMDRNAYVIKLCEQIRAAGKETENQKVSTIFFGGGTPSVLNEYQIQLLMDAVFSSFDVDNNAEISMEMNPGSLGKGYEETERLLGYRKAGINRVSIGLQSVHQKELQILGRIHTWEQFVQSYHCVRNAGFSNINIDLMSALPEQTEELWEESLRKTADLKPEHISAYSLIVEEGTPFYERYTGKGAVFLPDEETERMMYERTKQILEEYGYYRYEISNYAQKGKECRHNIGYWTGEEYLGLGLGASSYYKGMLEEYGYYRYEISNYAQKGKECRHNIGYWTGEEYLGLGLGASSYYKGMRFCSTSDMKRYMQADFLKDSGAVYEEKHIVTYQEAIEEFMFLGLRMMKGVSAEEFQKRFGRTIEETYGKILDMFITMNLMEKSQEKNGIYYRLTENGISVSNQVMCEFIDPQE